jgi:8-oxo-dGTP pyrophosphatase MutT (NUDIX family)
MYKKKNIFQIIFGWVKEVFYFILQFIFIFLGIFYRPKSGNFSEEKINIVLLPGILTRTLVFLPLVGRLKKLGFNPILFDYGLGFSAIKKNADKLNEFLKTHSKGKVILFGYSLGGLVIMEARRAHLDLKDIPTVTLGAPLKGSPVAKFLPFFDSHKDMIPEWEFIKKIKEEKNSLNNVIMARALYDEIVFGGFSCLDTDERCKIIDVVGHYALVFEIKDKDLLSLLSWYSDKNINSEFRPKPGQIDFTNISRVPVINCIVRYKDKILLVKRSGGMKFYPNYWNGISGFLDDDQTIEEKVLEELTEELGIDDDNITSMKKGTIIEYEDSAYKKTWLIHPVLVDINTDDVKIDWEAREFKWVLADELKNFELLPGFDEVTESLLK